MRDETDPITPEVLLDAYANGIFPMAESADSDDIFWLSPETRAIFEIGGFHTSRSLHKAIRRGGYDICLNRDFSACLRACADRPETWINDRIFTLYTQLHHMGFAHSCEIWRDEVMIGGVYGVALRGAFFGESMFSSATNGSKLALHHLLKHLKHQGFTLFDAQFITPHLASLGAVEISRAAYLERLKHALTVDAAF